MPGGWDMFGECYPHVWCAVSEGQGSGDWMGIKDNEGLLGQFCFLFWIYSGVYYRNTLFLCDVVVDKLGCLEK